MTIDPSSLTSFFGFDSILPTGRQNTFFNMIKLIQSQLQRLSASTSPASDTGSLTEEGASACAAAFAQPSSPLDDARDAKERSGLVQDPAKLDTSEPSHKGLRDAKKEAGLAVPPTELSSEGIFPVSVRQQRQKQEQEREQEQDDPRSGEVALLLSGGVDSSVALQLLLEQGHRVRAYYLKIWLEDEIAHLNSCPWEEDLRYAQAGAQGEVSDIFFTYPC
jgi:rhodanese-related sulfurtransferase